MLSSLHRPVCLSFRQYSRSFSTTATKWQETSILDEARSVFAQEQPSAVTSASQAAAASSKATTPTYYEVPPEKDPMLQFLTTSIMKHGRYARAQKIISEMLLHIHTLTRSPPLPIVHEAILKASPAVRVNNFKIGARSISRPLALSERQRTGHGIRWIIEASNNKPGIKLQLRLAKEMISVLKGDSAALAQKQQAHRSAMIARGSLTTR